jgi:hypothetical protein
VPLSQEWVNRFYPQGCCHWPMNRPRGQLSSVQLVASTVERRTGLFHARQGDRSTFPPPNKKAPVNSLTL